MTRRQVIEEERVVGWYDDERVAVEVTEGRTWNGNNMVGNCSGLQTTQATLSLTAGGRWVEEQDRTREFNGPHIRRYLTDSQARDWLMRADTAETEDVLGARFTLDEETGPAIGRPEIGPAFSVRFPTGLLARVDRAAADAGLTRAAWLRRVAEEALGESG